MADINNNNKTGLLYAKGKTNLIHERERKKIFFENWVGKLEGGQVGKNCLEEKTFLKRGEKKRVNKVTSRE